MNTRLDVPNIMEELPIGDAWQYVERVDETLRKDLESATEVGACLENIIAFEVARYILFHVGGDRTFDQCIPDHFGRLIYKEKQLFKKLTGKEYISKNDNW